MDGEGGNDGSGGGGRRGKDGGVGWSWEGEDGGEDSSEDALCPSEVFVCALLVP